MTTPPELWQRRQRQVADATAAQVVAAWAKVRAADAQRTFEAVLPQLLATVTAGQLAAASGAEQYVAAVLAQDGLSAAPVASVSAARFAGVASDGRSLVGLLSQPLIRTLHLRARGADDATALAGGRLSLETLVRTEVFDTGRDAGQVASALEPQVVGYYRQVTTPACSRCIILAGKFFKRNAGFDRHPGCDCQHSPATEAGDTGYDPRALFDGMSAEQQDRAFGKANAEVIRRGGNMGQVVNARRGMASAGSNWTTEGTTRRGVYGRAARARGEEFRKRGGRYARTPPRPSPGFLLEQAGGDPEKFALALERAGYL